MNKTRRHRDTELEPETGYHGVAAGKVSASQRKYVGVPAPGVNGAGESGFDPAVRARMEGLFGEDFGDVNVHTNAAETKAMGAQAFARGRDIYFAEGAYAPDTADGQFLLGHELAHVVQQRGSTATTQRKAVGPSSTSGLEAEADRVGRCIAAGRSVVGAIVGRASASDGVQLFGTGEHRKVGDRVEDEGGNTERVELADGYSISYGEMVAMAGDFFASIDQMRKFAKRPGPGVGTREEIEYVRNVKVNDKSSDGYSEAVIAAADARYYKLAGQNQGHFLDPNGGESLKDRARAAPVSMSFYGEDGDFDFTDTVYEMPANGVAGYHRNHFDAIKEAYRAGKQGGTVDAALAVEAFGGHYLTDAFASGHVRTERVAITDYWNAKVPHFIDASVEKMVFGMLDEAQKKLHVGPIGLPLPIPDMVKSMAKKDEAEAKIRAKLTGKEFGFGDLVSGALHDRDNANGVDVTIAGEDAVLYGDGHMDHRTADHAAHALRVSRKDVMSAFAAGKAGESAKQMLRPLIDDGLFAAERLMPQAKSSDEIDDPAKKAIDWKRKTVDELFADSQFQDAIALFAREKVGEISTAGLEPEEAAAVERGVKEPMLADPAGYFLDIARNGRPRRERLEEQVDKIPEDLRRTHSNSHSRR